MPQTSVSIIIPVHDAAPYVEACLRSVAQQTYEGPMECIIVDDASADDGPARIERLLAAYDGPIAFHFFRQPVNGGASAARNRAIRSATGDYVYCLDSDDTLPPSAIAALVDATRRGEAVDLVQGACEADVWQDYYDISHLAGTDLIVGNRRIQAAFFGHGRRVPANVCNKLVRRALLTDRGITFREGIVHEDQLWMFHILRYASTLALVQQPTYHRTYVPTSVMQASGERRRFHDWGLILQEILGVIEREGGSRLMLMRYAEEYAIMWASMCGDAVYRDVARRTARLLRRAGFSRLALMIAASQWLPFLPDGKPLMPWIYRRCERHLRELTAEEHRQPASADAPAADPYGHRRT